MHKLNDIILALFKLNPLTRVPLSYFIIYTFMFTVIWLHDKNEKLAPLCLIVLFKMRQT